MNPRFEKIWDERFRKRTRPRLKRRKARNRVPRPQRDAKDLVHYLQTRFIETTGQLKKMRDPTDPAVCDFIRVFGSWKQAVREAHGPPRPSITPPTSKEHIVTAVAITGIRTRDRYLQKRRETPEIFPSYHQVRRIFPTWAHLMNEVEKRDADIVLGKYMELNRKLKRTPTTEECKKWSVDLSLLRPVFKDKKGIDQFLS